MEYMHLLKILTTLRYIVRVRHFSNLPFAYCKNCSLALPWTLLHDSNSGGGPLFSKEQSVLSQVIRNSKGQNIRKGKKLITAGVTKIKYSLQKSRVFKMNLNPRVYRRKKAEILSSIDVILCFQFKKPTATSNGIILAWNWPAFWHFAGSKEW